MPVLGGNAIDHGFAYAGMVADAQLCNGVSKLNKGTTTLIAGLGVVTDGDDGASAPVDTSVAANFVGIVKYELNRVLGNDGLTVNAKHDMTVITHGVVYVQANVDVVKDDPVFLIVGDGTGTDQGKFSNVIGTGATLAVAIPGAKFVSTALASSFTKISLGLGG
jgi:X-X-X-Leu-X-X-Gly heptad repeat protein